jgi:FAD/FMN-containing dehydrogenase/Fe-S oxidoreductase
MTRATHGQGKAGQLGDALSSAVKGEVRFDKGSRALYSTDGSNYRQVPIGVVVPRVREDVLATLEVCRRFHAPVLSRGGGTSLAGQCCNVAVVLDFSKYLNGILEIDAGKRQAVIEPGLVLDTLRNEAKKHDLTFGPDPSTHSHCTLGGMMGNNSCGVHSVMAGLTSDNVEWMEVALYDGTVMTVGKTEPEELQAIIGGGGRKGEVYAALADLRDRYGDMVRERYPKIPRRVSGYNLDHLLPENGFHVARALVGSEGTLVTILRAGVRLVPWPKKRTLLVLGYPSIYEAADHVMEVMQSGPMGLEAVDQLLVSDMRVKRLHLRDLDLLPEGKGWLLVEYGGDSKEEADDKARRLMDKLENGPSMKLYHDDEDEAKIWEIRESGLGATARVPGQKDTWEGWEDSAVPPERLGEYLRRLGKLYDKHGYRASLYGHFGQGCVHTRIDYDLTTEEGLRDFRHFIDEASDLVVELGGSLSGEHGDGQSRAELLPKMFGPELIRAFQEFKAVWDPDNRMNPGKVVYPYKPTDNLRLGPHNYHPHPVRTHFTYPEEEGSFKRATQRCVGVGNCRQHGGGVMCPSYMATREEMHSTRGRSRLLFEMLEGDVVDGGWRDPHVRESLDLCLACKGCKGECPVNVDMATYKAEFLSHYYEGRLRPRSAYAMGLIPWWARLASLAPGLANLVSHAPVLSQLFKWSGGVAQKRTVPRFALRTFRHWFEGRGGSHPGSRGEVTLWVDTFTNHFHPEIGQAAVQVLEAAGFEVLLSPSGLCCGRPLYDYGMLDLARRLLQQNVAALQEGIERHRPMVALEPSCLGVFRDEMVNLLGRHDGRALRLRQLSYTLAGFLRERAPDFRPPILGARALFHGHCHQSALIGFDAELDLLRKSALEVECPDSGCCGMAGSFGFEAEHYEISQRIGERVLLPAVRQAGDSLLVADGFSCRTQIEQGTGRKALHIAQVLAGDVGSTGEQPRS